MINIGSRYIPLKNSGRAMINAISLPNIVNPIALINVTRQIKS